nr:DUF5060 domain-containing protein [Granulosicoccus sp.]
MPHRHLSIIFFSLLTVMVGPSIAAAASVSGELAKWSPLNVDFVGPQADETDDSPNPFLDYRLNVEFTSPSGNVYLVPGFFAGDGAGGNSGAIWRARFSADETGTWRYNAELRTGDEVAIALQNSAGSNVDLEGSSGEFRIEAARADAPGFLSQGRLEYVGGHYLKFRDGSYWIKGGTDSPENLLGFEGIDGTFDVGGIGATFLHDYANHINDYDN